MIRFICTTLAASLFIMVLCNCSSRNSQDDLKSTANTHFELLDSSITHVPFVNAVSDREDFNILTYRNFYNGGGVAIGDINNDDLPDLFFTANMGKNRLYLNRGDWQFEDISTSAGIEGTKAWSTGVTMADVNADGWLDIYVSNSGDVAGDNKENELYINNQNLTFSEVAAVYGLNNQGFSTQAAFFDYDLDGDLDCYLLNNSFKDPSKIELFISMRDIPDELGGDKLYRNDGGIFTDVTSEAGIYSSAIGFGLGTVIGDINHDFYPDIYVSNDFWERDYLYINQGDGTFSEELPERIDFCSISSMGGDMADINNDGHPEIISTDMLAGDNYRLKAMSAFDPYHLEDIKYRANYHYQIGQNCLHLNDGKGNFQEVAMLANVAATDWSWGALFFDFNNNGRKDLFVSNGIQRDIMYMDFRDFLANNSIFRRIEEGKYLDYPPVLARMPANPLRNFALVNESELQFVDRTQEMGLAQPSFSNGGAFGDLDNDGDYDLVINNVNHPAFVYENKADQLNHGYLKIRFSGPEKNPFGIGALVRVFQGNIMQSSQNFNTRGFQSCVEPELIFGLGNLPVDRLEVVWPDQSMQQIEPVRANQTITLNYVDADKRAELTDQLANPVFKEVTSEMVQGITRHLENQYNDFDHEILLLGHLSNEGPGIVAGDVNGDEREDFILLGASGDSDKLFLQAANGQFQRTAVLAFNQARDHESTCGALADFDEDGDLDLLVGGGGNEYLKGREHFQVRYYQNDGSGNFEYKSSQLSGIVGDFSCVETSDYDQDGDIDVFLGARAIPGNYGLPPRSYLMMNDNGIFYDVTPNALAGVGMVTDAVWLDLDQDRDLDLVVVGDWMGIQCFVNNGDSLDQKVMLPQSEGWWRSIRAADLDQDGDQDLIAGNWGLNSKFQASPDHPLTMHVNDFDQNGKSEFIINWRAPLDDQTYPFATKMDISQQLPYLRKQILKYEDYAKQTYESMFSSEVRDLSLSYTCHTLASCVIWNENGKLQMMSLPWQAQVSPVYAIVCSDFNQDQEIDIWLGGNFYALKPQVGRQNASRGTLLLGKGNHAFQATTFEESGIEIIGEVRDAQLIPVGNDQVLVVARNNDEIQVFSSSGEATLQ